MLSPHRTAIICLLRDLFWFFLFRQIMCRLLVAYVVPMIPCLLYCTYYGGFLIQFLIEKMGMMGSLPKPYGQYTASNFSSEFVEVFVALKHLVWIVEYHICNKSILVLDTLILCCLVIHTWNVVRLHCFLVLWDVGSLLEGTLHIKIWFLHLPFFSMMSCIWKINSCGMYYKITWE